MFGKNKKDDLNIMMFRKLKEQSLKIEIYQKYFEMWFQLKRKFAGINDEAIKTMEEIELEIEILDQRKKLENMKIGSLDEGIDTSIVSRQDMSQKQHELEEEERQIEIHNRFIAEGKGNYTSY